MSLFEDTPEFKAVEKASTTVQIRHLIRCMRIKNAYIAELETKVRLMEVEQESHTFELGLAGLAALKAARPRAASDHSDHMIDALRYAMAQPVPKTQPLPWWKRLWRRITFWRKR